MSDTPREIEMKFAIPAGRAAEVAAALSLVPGIEPLADVVPRQLVSTYFDTEKGALRRAMMALRVRCSGAKCVQTLKDAGDGALSRGEWERAIKGSKPNLAALKATPAARLVAKTKLAPVFVVDVARRTVEVIEGESRIELAFDQGVAKAKGREAAFAELELELKAGPQWGLFALARRLAGVGDLTLSFTTKAARGSVLARPPRSFAHKFAPPVLSPDSDAGHAFQAVARACLRQITTN